MRPGWTQHPCAPSRVHGPADQRRRRKNGRDAGESPLFRAARPPWPQRTKLHDARQNRDNGKVGFTAARKGCGEAERALSLKDHGGGWRTGRGEAKFSPGSELCGRIREGGGNAAKAKVKERDGAGGTGEVRRRRVGPGRDAPERPPRPVAAAASAGPFTGRPGQT